MQRSLYVIEQDGLHTTLAADPFLVFRGQRAGGIAAPVVENRLAEFADRH